MRRIARISSVGLLCACSLAFAACGDDDDDDVDDDVEEVVDTIEEGIDDLEDDSAP